MASKEEEESMSLISSLLWIIFFRLPKRRLRKLVNWKVLFCFWLNFAG